MHKSKPLQSLRHHRLKTSCEAEALPSSPAVSQLEAVQQKRVYAVPTNIIFG